MATAKQPSIAEKIALQLQANLQQNQLGDEASVTGNVNAKAVTFATWSAGCKFEGTATSYMGNSGITGTLNAADLRGAVYFLFVVKTDSFTMMFYSDANFTDYKGVLKASGKFSAPEQGSGQGTFTAK